MESTPDEAALVAAAKRGDVSAYESLLRMHQTVAYRTAFAITRSAEDAEDVVQAAFLKAHRAVRRFRRGAEFRPWLLTIVANEARNRRRTVARQLRLVHPGFAQAMSAPAPSVEAVTVEVDERRRLLAAVDGLGDEDRLAVVARYFVGLSVDETAAVLGVRRSAAKMRISRALDRLRAALGEDR
ncbi:MAG TPA: RNA polymerase sigma factor [Gaiellaceae bacterium]